MIRVARIIFTAGLIAMAAPLQAQATSVLASAVGGAADGFTKGVARTVQSMIEYTRWPALRNPIALCVAGPANYADRLGGLRLSDGRAVNRYEVSPTGEELDGCDVIYIGAVPAPTARRLVDAVRGKEVLTIAEFDPGCRGQAMYCLVISPRSLSFRLNIDAVSRSGLRVDPRVLRLVQGG